MKTAIITDTNSGMLVSDAEAHGIYLLPMPVIINGKEYLEHVNLDPDTFYSFQAEGADITTSQPSAGDVMDLWNKLLRDYEEIVHIPMSSGLSSSYSSAALYAQDYDGRVQVVDNQRISVTQRQSALDAKALADSGVPAAEIKRILEETRFRSHIYIMVDTLKYLKKGGRITPAAAMVAGVLNIKPVLQIQGEKLDAFSKCRGIKAAKKIIREAVMDGVVNDFGGLNPENPTSWIGIAHTHNEEAALAFAEEAQEIFPGHEIHMDELPMSIAAHIGPGSIAMTCTEVLPGGVQYKK
ncbi:MAG: DegV family protein [Lachnospiraceae bacterium]|nr:DegV family protein [Lachnospiraceae bacterium]